MRSPWFVLIIVLLASLAAPLNQFKVPPVMPLLMGTFGASAGQAGLLMSLFAITGLLLAIRPVLFRDVIEVGTRGDASTFAYSDGGHRGSVHLGGRFRRAVNFLVEPEQIPFLLVNRYYDRYLYFIIRLHVLVALLDSSHRQ